MASDCGVTAPPGPGPQQPPWPLDCPGGTGAWEKEAESALPLKTHGRRGALGGPRESPRKVPGGTRESPRKTPRKAPRKVPGQPPGRSGESPKKVPGEPQKTRESPRIVWGKPQDSPRKVPGGPQEGPRRAPEK